MPRPYRPPGAFASSASALRRLTGRGLGALALALLATCACSPGEPDDGKIHLTYWEKWTRFEGQAMQNVVDAFNRSQDRIVVHMHTFGAIDRKVLAATAGGNPPDLAGLWASNVVPFAERRALSPLDEHIAASGLPADHWLTVYADLCRHAGHTWAVPTTPSATALYWNKALFRAAGLDPERPPTTIAELDAMAERLTRTDVGGNITQMGFLPNEPDWFVWSYPLWFGGTLFDGREITATHANNAAALEWIQSYPRRYQTARIKRFTSGFGNFSSPQNPFFAGKIAMVLHGVWLHSYIRQYAPGMDYGVAPWPKTPNGPAKFTIADCDVAVIPAGVPPQRRAAAWQFLAFLSSQKGMEILCLGQQKNTPLTKVSEQFRSNHPHPYIDVFIDLSRSPAATHFPRIGMWQQYDQELRAAIEKMRLLQVNPATGRPYTSQEALATVQQRITRAWDRHRSSLALRNGVEATP